MLKPHKNSLFSMLLRSPWWVGLLIAVGLFFVSRLFLPPVAAAASTFPFVGIAAYAAWRQMQIPSPRRVAAVLKELRGMSWEQFSTLMAAVFRRDGYEVTALQGGAADYALRKLGYLSLVACRRWKVEQTGIAPVRELFNAGEAGEARNCIYVTAGELSANAKAFAAEKGIRVLSDADLVTRIGRRSRA